MSQESDSDGGYKPVIDDLPSQSRGPYGQYAFVHKECLERFLSSLSRNKQVVLKDQIEEFNIAKVMKEHEIKSIGICDECGQEISPKSNIYCRLWVVKISDYNAYLSKQSQDVLTPQEALELDRRVKACDEEISNERFHDEVWVDSLRGLDDLVNKWVNGNLDTEKFLVQHAELFACCEQISKLAKNSLKTKIEANKERYERHFKLHTSPKQLLPIYRVKYRWFG